MPEEPGFQEEDGEEGGGGDEWDGAHLLGRGGCGESPIVFQR